MSATKEQERKALGKIRKIVDDLGEDSYVGAAFEGCFEIAESNIDNDFLCSMKQNLEQTTREKEIAESKLKETMNEAKLLKKALDRELEFWKPYEIKENVSQSEYIEATRIADGDESYISDDKAKSILEDWYGFSSEKITICREVPAYEINKHHMCRENGTVERRPFYFSSDLNYIRFDCGCMRYELFNGELRFFSG